MISWPGNNLSRCHSQLMIRANHVMLGLLGFSAAFDSHKLSRCRMSAEKGSSSHPHLVDMFEMLYSIALVLACAGGSVDSPSGCEVAAGQRALLACLLEAHVNDLFSQHRRSKTRLLVLMLTQLLSAECWPTAAADDHAGLQVGLCWPGQVT